MVLCGVCWWTSLRLWGCLGFAVVHWLSVVVGGFVTFVCFWVGGCLACVGLLSVCVCDLLIVEWFSGVYAVVAGL